MDGVGKRLKALRKIHGLGAINVARAAYAGEEVPARTIVNFASYIGRVERGHLHSRNLKLDVLERLARGFKLTLSSFFAELEGVLEIGTSADKRSQLGQTGAALIGQDSSLVSGGSLAKLQIGDDRVTLSATAEVEEDRAILTRFASALLNVIAGRQAPTPRRKSTKRPQSARTSRRSVAR